MKRAAFAVLVALSVLLPWRALAVSALSTSDFTYNGSATVALRGNASFYGQGLASRKVSGQVRLLHLSNGWILDEFVPPAVGNSTTSITRSWDIGAAAATCLDDFNGIWYEDAASRLWITSATDYTDTYEAAHICTMTLNDNQTVSNVKKITLNNLPERRAYGGVQPCPITISGKPYATGWGGYTSVVTGAGGASVGPVIVCFADPAGLSNGASVAGTTVLDTCCYQDGRGVRVTAPKNYYDGGDTRPNPSTPPAGDPDPSGDFLSPNTNAAHGPLGANLMVIADSYFNTGMLIDTGAKRGFAMVASLCAGKCYYMSSDDWSEQRVRELHVWDTSTLNTSNPLVRPTSMVQLSITDDPGGHGTRSGDTQAMNIAGATYIDGTMYTILCGDFSGYPNQYACNLGNFSVAQGSVPPSILPRLRLRVR